MRDSRWEEDTLFLVFEEDYRFRPDEEPQEPQQHMQPAHLGEQSDTTDSATQHPKVDGFFVFAMGLSCLPSQTGFRAIRRRLPKEQEHGVRAFRPGRACSVSPRVSGAFHASDFPRRTAFRTATEAAA